MAGIALGGLASGIDTDSVISQLMAIERAPQTRLQLKQSVLQTRQSALTDVATRLRSLQSTVKDLSSATTWLNSQSLDVSDTTKLTATRLSGAAPGGHTIDVTSLARSEQRSYKFAPGAASLNVGGAPIDVTDTDTGQDVADKINASPGAPVYAVFVKDPLGDPNNDRLVLTRKETGAFDPADLVVDGAAWTTPTDSKLGVDAEFTVDGDPTVLKSHSNIVTSAVAGLELTLKGTGTTSVTVGPP